MYFFNIYIDLLINWLLIYLQVNLAMDVQEALPIFMWRRSITKKLSVYPNQQSRTLRMRFYNWYSGQKELLSDSINTALNPPKVYLLLGTRDTLVFARSLGHCQLYYTDWQIYSDWEIYTDWEIHFDWEIYSDWEIYTDWTHTSEHKLSLKKRKTKMFLLFFWGDAKM